MLERHSPCVPARSSGLSPIFFSRHLCALFSRRAWGGKRRPECTGKGVGFEQQSRERRKNSSTKNTLYSPVCSPAVNHIAVNTDVDTYETPALAPCRAAAEWVLNAANRGKVPLEVKP